MNETRYQTFWTSQLNTVSTPPVKRVAVEDKITVVLKGTPRILRSELVKLTNESQERLGKALSRLKSKQVLDYNIKEVISLSDDTIRVIQGALLAGKVITLPSDLDQHTFQAVIEYLIFLGGKPGKRSGTFEFPVDADELLDKSTKSYRVEPEWTLTAEVAVRLARSCMDMRGKVICPFDVAKAKIVLQSEASVITGQKFNFWDTPKSKYEAVVLFPPLLGKQELDAIQQGLKWLERGGKLVAVVSNRINQEAGIDLLMGMHARIEKLQENKMGNAYLVEVTK